MARGPCSLTLAQTCPNCGGELLRRPHRRRKPEGIHRDLIRRLHSIWNTGESAAIDSVYAPEFVAHFPPSSELPERRGLEGVRQGVTRIRARETSTGTHRGLFWGVPPTGRTVVLPEISIFRVAGGRVVEQWCVFDELGRMEQSGATLLRPTAERSHG